jgi:peptide/nickel transport system permease protein
MNIWTYVLRKVINMIPTLFGICLIIFVLFNLVAPDPALLLLGRHGTEAQIAQIHFELGLDRPFWLQYLDIVKTAFTFDFGYSWSTKQEIWSMIKNGALPSLSITLPSFLIGNFIAVCLSLLISYYRGKFVDKFFVILCVAMMSIPALAYILFGQYFLAYSWGLFEISGYEYGLIEMIPYILLPILMSIIIEIGPEVRYYRTAILDEVYQDYVRTARAKGLSEKVVFFKHVLKNAMIPILTSLVTQIPFLVLGSILLESFFSIPGLGGITLKAINTSDFPVIKAMTILSAIAFMIFNLLTDLLYTVVDPRLKLK